MTRKRLFLLFAVSLVLLISAGAGWFFYRTRGMIFNHVKIEQMAASFLPGARPLPGCGGVVAVEKERLQAAIFAPSAAKARPGALENQELRIIIAQLKLQAGEDRSLDKLSETVANATRDRDPQGPQTLEKAPVRLQVSGRPHLFMRSIQQVGGEQGKRNQVYSTIFLIAGKVVLLQICGPEATFNQAGMDTFLGGLEIPAPFSGRRRFRRGVPTEPDASSATPEMEQR